MIDLAEASATQSDPTQCVCGHPRSDHGDGIVHTACCGDVECHVPPTIGTYQCGCEAFEAAR